MMKSALILVTITAVAAANAAPPEPDHHWSLESASSDGLSLQGGEAVAAEGVRGKSLALDGHSVLEIKDSADLTENDAGFTFTVWVNPYSLGRDQQMIAAKNRYSLNERQWGVMIDKDRRFRLYVWQGKWFTAEAAALPRPGHWHLVGAVVRPDEAELWVNGERAGRVALGQPIPDTKAPLTFGGVNDNGRIWQNLFGALDEVQLFDRPLSAAQMAGLYEPVTATHAVDALLPPLPEPVSLWDESSRLPKAAEAPVLDGVEFHVIKPYEFDTDGYRFLHGVALAWHKGKLYASFGHNRGGENTDTEEARFRVSEDGGTTWSDVRTIDDGDEPGIGVSHGVFLSHEGRLWAFHGTYSGIMQNVHTRASTLDESTGRWQSQGTVVQGGFWPMTEPVKMDDGNWIMPGIRVSDGNPAAVAISHGDDLTKWDLVVIPCGGGIGSMWGESTVIVDGACVVNISRYGQRAQALAAQSKDYGRTWSPMVESDLPMVTSKPCAGVLSTGQRYLIATTTADSGKRRAPLTIAVSKPGEARLCKVFVIRHAEFPEGPGESHENASLAYPYAVEHDGKLYVGYSNNGGNVGRTGEGRELWNNNSAEMAVIPIQALAVDAVKVEK